ncbi:hypothetical protein [Persephonella sp.]
MEKENLLLSLFQEQFLKQINKKLKTEFFVQGVPGSGMSFYTLVVPASKTEDEKINIIHGTTRSGGTRLLKYLVKEE